MFVTDSEAGRGDRVGAALSVDPPGGGHPYGAEPAAGGVPRTVRDDPPRVARVPAPVTSSPPPAGGTLARPGLDAPPLPGGIQPLPAERRLPRGPGSGAAGLYWVAAHGGAGVTTLTRLMEGTVTLGARWPVTPARRMPVVLVARTHYAGLRALRDAAIDHASGQVPGVDLIGWALIRDAPGKLPGPLRDLMHHLSGAAPTDQRGRPLVWELPWVEPWRLGLPRDAAGGHAPQLDGAPRDYRALAADLTDLVPALRGGQYPTTSILGSPL